VRAAAGTLEGAAVGVTAGGTAASGVVCEAVCKAVCEAAGEAVSETVGDDAGEGEAEAGSAAPRGGGLAMGRGVGLGLRANSDFAAAATGRKDEFRLLARSSSFSGPGLALKYGSRPEADSSGVGRTADAHFGTGGDLG